jgi:carboxyl-terminal processing protease
VKIRSVVLLTASLLAVCEVSVVAAQEADSADDGQLADADRAWIASRVYRGVELNFGHWDDVPGYDLPVEYREYLDRAMGAADRKGFSLATQEFVASLGNSHTYFADRALYEHAGPSHGYTVRYLEGDWVVIRSRRPELSAGDVIVSVDEEPIDVFFDRNRRYLNTSTERYARRRLFFWNQRHLWPEAYTLGLADGRSVPIDGPAPQSSPLRPVVDGRWLEPDRVAYIRVGSWNDQEYQERAMELLEEFRSAEALIVDVRGNGGGSTPVPFISGLMDRPWRWYAEATPMRLAVFANMAEQGRDGYSDFRRPMMSWPASVEEPDSLFTGRLAILVDAGCHSACEDFTMPFKDNGRAVLVGEATAGSSGQPYYEDLGDGMRLAVGTKREFFPDGSRFEGVGIAPDLVVLPTAAEIRGGRDPELKRALEALQASD